ncbi:hypothetical protein HK104_003251 [Borealophlyctis nickersoniae]|nr:hypothetical protein HK104_003251 [Borealophlyctis nickersoniae]
MPNGTAFGTNTRTGLTGYFPFECITHHPVLDHDLYHLPPPVTTTTPALPINIMVTSPTDDAPTGGTAVGTPVGAPAGSFGGTPHEPHPEKADATTIKTALDALDVLLLAGRISGGEYLERRERVKSGDVKW